MYYKNIYHRQNKEPLLTQTLEDQISQAFFFLSSLFKELMSQSCLIWSLNTINFIHDVEIRTNNLRKRVLIQILKGIVSDHCTVKS